MGVYGRGRGSAIRRNTLRPAVFLRRRGDHLSVLCMQQQNGAAISAGTINSMIAGFENRHHLISVSDQARGAGQGCDGRQNAPPRRW